MQGEETRRVSFWMVRYEDDRNAHDDRPEGERLVRATALAHAAPTTMADAPPHVRVLRR